MNMKTINKVFRDAFDDMHFDCLWLAEGYKNIDVKLPDCSVEIITVQPSTRTGSHRGLA